MRAGWGLTVDYCAIKKTISQAADCQEYENFNYVYY